MMGRFKRVPVLMWCAAVCVCLAVPSGAAEAQPWAPQACVAGAGAEPAGAQRAGSDPSQIGPGIVTRMSSGLAADGSASFHAISADLEVTKKVSRTGAYTLQLSRGDDAVEVRADRSAVSVNRGGRSVWIDLDVVSEEDLAAVRALLVGSRSVRALRALAATLGNGPTRSPGVLAVVMADAVLGVLDGDPAAAERLAERLGGRRTAVRRVSFEEGCYERWEAEVIRAYDSYLGCVSVYMGITQWREACGLRWLLWAESAWFSFLMCSGSPFHIM